MMRVLLGCILFTFLAVCQGLSQQDFTLYGMDNVTQVTYTNPSTKPMGLVNIGLPGISSVSANYFNTFFTPKSAFQVNDAGTILRSEHLKKMWKKRNYLNLSAEIDLLSFGFVKGKEYYSFNITENIFARATLPGDLLRFPFTGNANFEELNGSTLDFSNLRIDLNHYREYSFGVQRQMNDKLRLGAKIKYLYGMENIRTGKSSLMWETDSVTFDWKIEGELEMNTSGVYPLLDSIEDNSYLDNGEYGKYFFKKKNRGLGMDLGATYQYSEKLKFSASIIDLGFIRWKSENRNIKSNGVDLALTGIDFSNAIFIADSVRADTLNQLVNDLFSEVGDSFTPEDNTKNYTTSLVSRFYIGATYQWSNSGDKINNAGILFQGEIYHGRFRPSLTLSASYNLKKSLQSTFTYTLANRDYTNIGFGISMNLFPVQIYLISDNILAGVLSQLYYKRSDGSQGTLTHPYSSKTTHVRAGINLTFGRDPDKDLDGVINKFDKCEEVPGLAEFDGCPDTDGDKVPDNIDMCPHVVGVAQCEGCPDLDGDGIRDSKDNCPEESGAKEHGGCPDSDGDGIVDSEDLCPKMAGLEKYNGCPDTDGDGLFDPYDKCPNEYGEIENRGCPEPKK